MFGTLKDPHSSMEATLQELSDDVAIRVKNKEKEEECNDAHIDKKKRHDDDHHHNGNGHSDELAEVAAGPIRVDWAAVPGECMIFGADNAMGGKKKGKDKIVKVKKNDKGKTTSWKAEKKEARVERKERQCDAFVAAITALNLPPGAVVVDGGCGSCGLTLPLAWTFPQLNFVGIDMNPVATRLMMERVAASGMTNVRAFTSSISAFSDPFDLAIGLHACGQASDDIINLAVMNHKPYLVAPCCFGKLKFSFRSNTFDSLKLKSGGDVGSAGCAEIPLPQPVKRGPTPPRPIDENHCGYVARRLRENEGSWDALPYPRSEWLQCQLQTGAEEINRAASVCLQERIMLAQEERRTADEVDGTENSTGETVEAAVPVPSRVTSFSDRGDMRVLSLDERMNSMYLAVAGYADNSHMRSASEVLPIGSNSEERKPLPPKTDKEKKRDMEHEFYRLCSNIICVDRNEFAVEKAGYCTRICSIPGLASSAKSDMLIGWLPSC